MKENCKKKMATRTPGAKKFVEGISAPGFCEASPFLAHSLSTVMPNGLSERGYNVKDEQKREKLLSWLMRDTYFNVR